MNRRVSHLIAGWRTGLSRPVLILQAGNALSPAPVRSSTVHRIVSCRHDDKTRGSPKEGKTSLPNVVIAEM